ncbi:hypothetical protein DX887_23080 [Vibrio alginolyticus]|nr:hypothetical protein [Vibrio alginolyticus]KPM85916.1 hypothetical protein AOR10_23785 [Vibrio alginolyticus]
MLYKSLTLKVGDKKSDNEVSRVLSREAKNGFVVSNMSTTLSPDGELVSNYLLQRVPISHLENEPGDPPNLRRILLGNSIHYWDPCGDPIDPHE